MAILPGADTLQIDARKLVYLLTSGKAAFFISCFGHQSWTPRFACTRSAIKSRTRF